MREIERIVKLITENEYFQRDKVLQRDPEKYVGIWKQAFPDVDILSEVKKTFSYFVGKPYKAPKSNYRKFMHSWLSRPWVKKLDKGRQSRLQELKQQQQESDLEREDE